jgi:aspartyl-tRNA(Asn)/glutamyl-tRNA(Gln) amidotransferase subunit A
MGELSELADALRRGERSPLEVVSQALAAIERLEPQLGAFTAVYGEQALAQARACEALGPAERGPLWGVPLGVKDIIDVAGWPTEACSRIQRGHRARRDAAVVRRLRAAGAVIIGKLNTHEFAYGSTTTSPHRPPTRNPWDPARICGGSSGGSAAAVAAGLLPGAIGTDTAGSVRVPGALCGVSALRPTHGAISTAGVFPVARSFDTVGPIARSAEDCALLLMAMAEHPGKLPDAPAGFSAAARGPDAVSLKLPPPRGLRVGVVGELLHHQDLQAGIGEALGRCAQLLADAGARPSEHSVPWLADAALAQQAVQYPQAAEVHLDWLRACPGEYGRDVRVRLLVGLALAASAQATGERALAWLGARARALFEEVDLLLAPSLAMVAPHIGEETPMVDGREVPYRQSIIPFNSPWSALGLAALSIPSGFVDGLPVGAQLVGPRWSDWRVLGAAHAIQQRSDWHLQRPPLHADATARGLDGG